LKKLHNVHPAFFGFALGAKRMRHPEFRSNIALRQVGFFARLDQPQKEQVIIR